MSSVGLDSSVGLNFDYMFKIILVGDAGVGKTAFISQYCDRTFTSTSVSTIGIDFRVVSLERNGKTIKLQLWDTAGQERYHSMTTSYYRGANGFIVLFDLTDEKSFNNCSSWISDIASHCQEDYVVVLAGNKLDLHNYRIVEKEEAKRLAEDRNIRYFECSTKENHNIVETLDCVVDLIIKSMGITFDSIKSDVDSRKMTNCSC